MSEDQEIQEKDNFQPEAGSQIPLSQQNTAETEVHTSNSTSEPSTMEVHHHGHVHEQKKWKEYLFQFLMLFLAVFCGFLAEYQLEHIIEKNREKQYIRSFAEDLAADNAYMQERLIAFNEKIKIADSLAFLLINANTKESINSIYYYFKAIGRHTPFDVNDRTIVQLRNAGGMRLISNKNVTDTIINYYRNVDNINYLDQRLVAHISTIPVSTDKLLDAVDWGKLTDTLNNTIPMVNEPLKLRTRDPEIINAAIMNVHRIKNINIAQKLFVKQLRERANATRQFILNEYDLE